jgi:hypothetical protein
MKRILRGAAVGAACLQSSLGGAQSPELQAGVLLGPAASYEAAPEVADWNGDGKKDLLIGEFYYGDIVVFLNTGTDPSPSFGGYSHVRASGTDIRLNYG